MWNSATTPSLRCNSTVLSLPTIVKPLIQFGSKNHFFSLSLSDFFQWITQNIAEDVCKSFVTSISPIDYFNSSIFTCTDQLIVRKMTRFILIYWTCSQNNDSSIRFILGCMKFTDTEKRQWWSFSVKTTVNSVENLPLDSINFHFSTVDLPLAWHSLLKPLCFHRNPKMVSVYLHL